MRQPKIGFYSAISQNVLCLEKAATGVDISRSWYCSITGRALMGEGEGIQVIAGRCHAFGGRSQSRKHGFVCPNIAYSEFILGRR